MKKNEYKCNNCGEIYEYGWSEEEAIKEMVENWGYLPKDERIVICDDCYNFMNPNLPQNKEIARKSGFIK